MCYCAEERKTSVTVIDSGTFQAAIDVASQTDEDVTTTQRLTYSSLAWMIRQFLTHINVRNSPTADFFDFSSFTAFKRTLDSIDLTPFLVTSRN